MIDAATFKFLRDLGKNNDKEWFEAHRDRYETALENLTDVAATLIDAAASYDEAVAGLNLDPKTCVSRIHRDMRFQKGKPPYKTDWFVMLGGNPQAGKSAGYFLHVQSGGSFAGGGLYTPDAETLHRIRERISTRFSDWKKVAEGKRLTSIIPDGVTPPDELKTIPHGFDKDDPAAEYLRMKGYVANRALRNGELEGDDAHQLVIEAFKAAKPLVAFLNAD